MAELFFRAEDLQDEEILTYLVETAFDRKVINTLKGRSPVILRGSRGVGKSFLLRTAAAELRRDLRVEKVLPVYVTFARATLISHPTPERFLAWMISKICNRIIRAARAAGYALPNHSSLTVIQGGVDDEPSRMERIEEVFESEWRSGLDSDQTDRVPAPELLADAVEDFCRSSGLKRINLYIDEAAHVFIPRQQRQFFTLMRDLRTPYLSVKAAVYPGATSFGDSFQPTHDATTLVVDRSITDHSYGDTMRELVLRQDASLEEGIKRHGEEFDTLAYAASGNPRILLKTLARSLPLNRRRVQDTIREYYREAIWAEHSSLSDRYSGHSQLIEWGRHFVEEQVLPDLYKRNLHRKSETSSYLWIHRHSPPAVREALRLLCYSGILQEGDSGIRATRSEVGTRYMVNLGCQIALDADPVTYATPLRQGLSLKRMVEYGSKHPSYRPIDTLDIQEIEDTNSDALTTRLRSSVEHLDITPFQREKLAELQLSTIGDVLASDEAIFLKAYYVGAVRARQMRNAAVAAVLEYLSG